MSHIKSVFLCSSISLMLGAGIAWAVPRSVEIDSARHALLESIKHLKAANQSNPVEPDDPHISKAMDYMDLAKVELDAISTSHRLSN